MYVEQFRLMLSTFSFFGSIVVPIAAARNGRGFKDFTPRWPKNLTPRRQAFGVARRYVDSVRRFFGDGRNGFGIEILRFPDRDKIISYQHA